MDSRLKLLLNGDPKEVLMLLVRLKNPEAIVPYCKVVTRFGDVITCRIQRRYLLDVYHSPDVLSVKAPRLVPASAEAVRPNAGSLSKPSRRLQLPYNGAGVYFAAIDWGFDFAHANLRNPDGTTRFACIWDQNGTYDNNMYGYGCFYFAHQINKALQSDTPYEALGYHPGTSDIMGAGMHGTHVMDIATGTPVVGEGGLAPGTQYIAVQLGSNFVNGSDLALGDSVRLVEALHFIRTAAYNAPCVINMSLGSHGDSHTGKSLVEIAMDNFVEQNPGFAIVQSVGNYYSANCHLAHTLKQDESFPIEWNIPRGRFPNEVEIWYPGSDEFAVQLIAPNGDMVIDAKPFCDLQISHGETSVGYIFHRRLEPNTGLNHIDIILDGAAPKGKWIVQVIGKKIKDGSFHAYCERNDISQSRFSPRQSSGLTTTGSVCNGKHSITVGAYDHNNPSLPVVRFSSSGPTAIGQSKPDLLAPGYKISAARSSPPSSPRPINELTVKSGSSMAAPHVSGSLALLFQKHLPRRLPISETKRLLFQSLDPLPGAFSDTDKTRSGKGILNTIALLAPTKKLIMDTNDYTSFAAPGQLPSYNTRRRRPVALQSVSNDTGFEAEAVTVSPTDTRIDVRAKFALQHMLAEGGQAAIDAEGLITAINTERLSAITGDNTRMAVNVARRLGTQRWLLVPKGQDSAVITVEKFPPGIIFRDGIENTPGRLENALRDAWAEFNGRSLTIIFPPESSKTLRKGDTGPAVSLLQRSLNNFLNNNNSNFVSGEPGVLFNPLTVDGIFGSLTRQAVVAFQQYQGLVSDGIVGLQTWGKLLKVACTPTATSVTWSPIHADELSLKGTTFELGKISIYVPPKAKENPDVNKIIVFFTANNVTGSTSGNDFITHGLRGAADNSDWIVIGLGSPGDRPISPDFEVITTQKIKDCLKAVCRPETITCLRLAAHSRGHRGLTRTLMGNDNPNPGVPLEQASINTPFIDVSLIDRIVVYDAFFQSAKRVIASLGIAPAKVTVFKVTDGIGPNHPSSRFVDLTGNVSKIAGLGCIRFIQGTSLTNPGVVPAALLANPVVAGQLPLLTQTRGTFSSLATTPTGQQDYKTFIRGISSIRTPELLSFFNTNNLVRFRPFMFNTLIAAHHLFVQEFVHELFE